MENSTSSTQIALGFDLSTQSLKVVALNSSNQITFKSHINYDADLPHYKTTMGVHSKPNNQVTSPVLMWLEAIDLLLSRMKAENFPFDQVVAVSGSGQQHGSVYWTSQGQEILQNLNEDKLLLEQFKGKKSFSVEDSPIWMDNSTTEYCLKLEKHLNGAINLAQMTGSRAYERFTGNQIAKIADQTPEIYKETVHISLVSSFFAEIFLGKFSHIDFSDGCGMNLLDLQTGNWNPEICKFISEDLETKLDKPVPSHTVLGKVSSYFVKKYGFKEDCAIVACSGDNPNSLVGLGMFDTSDVGISLGTSDTIFGLVPEKESNKNLEGHIFISPVDPKLHFIMICTKNGSSVREKVKREYAGNSWESFDGLLKETSPGNNGKLCLMYEYPEIVPYIEGSDVQYLFDNEGNPVKKFTDLELIRGVIEGKIVALKYHAAKKGLVPKADGRILITGGGSKNKEILQIIANVFQKEVNVMQIEDSASLGAAIRAWHGYKSEKEGKLLEFGASFKEFLEERNKNLTIVKPDCELKEVYQRLEKLYEKVLPSISRNIENEI